MTFRPGRPPKLIRPARGTHYARMVFELKDVVTPTTAQATAYVLERDSNGDYVWASDAEEREVHFDVYGTEHFRGRARDTYSSPHDRGTRGVAVQYQAGGRWECEWLQPNALMIHGQLTDDLTGTDSTFTIDGVDVLQPTGSLICDQDPGDEITVYNTFGWSGDDNGECIAVWDESDDHWKAIQVECPA